MALPHLPNRTSWLDSADHLRWLAAEQERLVTPHAAACLQSRFGAAELDLQLRPKPAPRYGLFSVARYVHCFALEHLGGRPGADTIATRGINTLLDSFIDSGYDGFFGELDTDGRACSTVKTAYGHAFVLLAASSGLMAELPRAQELLHRVDAVIDQHFWQDAEGAVVDAFSVDWQLLEPNYRGQNANMHLTEAYMAAFDATGNSKFLQRARRIARRIVLDNAPQHLWRIPEHYDATWRVLPDYNLDRPNDPFRSPGSHVGHWLEWARLLVQLANYGELDWAEDAARRLFDAAIRDGWDTERSGFRYNVTLSGAEISAERFHWVMAEAVGAAVALARVTGEQQYAQWYETFWSYIASHIIDPQAGGWWHQVTPDGVPVTSVWDGKPDLYHALQATLYARSDPRSGLQVAARRGR